MPQLPNRPFADIVRPGKPWTAVPAGPDQSYVDLVQHVISAPHGSDHLSTMIRAHELAHARFSQVYTQKVRKAVAASEPAFQMAEDYLITVELARRKLPVPCGCAECTHEANRIADLLAESLKALGHPDPLPGCRAVTSIKMNTPTYWQDEPDQPLIENTFDAIRRIYMACGRGTARTVWRNRRKLIAEYLETLLAIPGPKHGGSSKPDQVPDPKTAAIDWREMKIERPPLCQSRLAPSTRKQRASDTGSVLRLIHRATVDGCVFTRKQKVQGATVLLDGSGSMGFSETELDDLVTQFPAGTVAIYSGGQLVIIADRGRRVQRLPGMEGSNECDGPALDWLTRQPGPRFWVTDLGVTERGTGTTKRALEYCLHTAAKHAVRILPKAAALITAKQQPRRTLPANTPF